jgi:hypothetical protein
MNGSELYNKYKKVHIGAFINIHTDVLSGVKDWLTGNLFYKKKDAPQAYLIPLDPSKPRQRFTNRSSRSIVPDTCVSNVWECLFIIFLKKN